MSYTIETRSVKEFVMDNRIKLPRFQRKATWKRNQNFELAISMFKEYPLGVVVINDEGETSWLLDGRQRRSALKELRENPDAVYEWARKYIGFKATESEDTLKEAFWDKVESYLLSDDESSNDDSDDTLNDSIELYTTESDIDRHRQLEGLNLLLDIILMVHQRKKDSNGNDYGKWERIFNLVPYLSNLPFALKRDNFKINPIALHSYILELGTKAGKNLSPDFFEEYFDENIREGQQNSFHEYINTHWNDISNIIRVVVKSEDIFIRARIGVILLKNVTPLDAQNIFSRINTGGTPLNPEELFSAKPFWNEPITMPSSKLTSIVKDLYQKLDVDVQDDGKIVRWDLIATLLVRIKDSQLFFEDYSQRKLSIDNKTIPEIKFGFKLAAAWFTKGISKVHINNIEKIKTIIWGSTIDDFVDDFNSMCKVLLSNEFFRTLNLWKQPLSKLLGEAATFEFCTIMLIDWKDRGEPMAASAELYNFIRDAKILLDRLMFEYAIGAWKGSGDSKMANHLSSWKERLTPIEESSWSNLISNACDGGVYNGQPLQLTNIKPLLYYQLALRKKHCPLDSDKRFEIDHIIPQAKLDGNPMSKPWFKDSLSNLSILPERDNNSKKDKALLEITDSVLTHLISEFTGIPQTDFKKFSDIENLDEFVIFRKNLWLNAFNDKRNSHLSNT